MPVQDGDMYTLSFAENQFFCPLPEWCIRNDGDHCSPCSMYIHLHIHTHLRREREREKWLIDRIIVNPGSCYEAHSTAGCEDSHIQRCVCDINSDCCTEQWYSACSKVAMEQCAGGPVSPTPTPTPTPTPDPNTPSEVPTPTPMPTPTPTPDPNTPSEVPTPTPTPTATPAPIVVVPTVELLSKPEVETISPIPDEDGNKGNKDKDNDLLWLIIAGSAVGGISVVVAVIAVGVLVALLVRRRRAMAVPTPPTDDGEL
jgi:hypothetical protein